MHPMFASVANLFVQSFAFIANIPLHLFAKETMKQMGEIREMENWITAKDIAKMYGVSSRTVNNWWNENFAGQEFDVNAKVSPERVAKMTAGKAKKGSAISAKRPRNNFNPQRHKPLPPAPDKTGDGNSARTFFDRIKSITAAQIRTALFNILAVGVVVGHGVLIWVECSQLWGMVGAIGGGVVFTVVLLAVLLASDPSKNRTSTYALWFMACVDTAAFWVHYPSFKTYSVSDAVTVGVCVFICACSFVALVLFQDSKLS